MAALRLGRPGNAVLSAVAVLVGAIAASSGDALGHGPVGWAMLSAATGTMGGNVLNDLADREIDRHAHPERALVTGAVTPRGAAGFLLVLWLVALGAAALVSMTLLVVAALLLGVLVAYEVALKGAGFAGNVAVAVVAGALFPFGALSTSGGAGAALGVPLVLGGIAALAHLGRELQKDAEDVVADAAVRRTLAVRHGPRVAGAFGAGALVGAVALSPVPHLAHGWSDAYLVAVAPAAVVFLVSAWTGLGAPGPGRAWAKLGMLLALVAFLVGALW